MCVMQCLTTPIRYGVLFKKYDADLNGTLEFRELREIVRQELKLPNRVFSEVARGGWNRVGVTSWSGLRGSDLMK